MNYRYVYICTYSCCGGFGSSVHGRRRRGCLTWCCCCEPEAALCFSAEDQVLFPVNKLEKHNICLRFRLRN
jgi:hypothetical protein